MWCFLAGLSISLQLKRPEVMLFASPATVGEKEGSRALLLRTEFLLDYSRHQGQDNLVCSLSDFHVINNNQQPHLVSWSSKNKNSDKNPCESLTFLWFILYSITFWVNVSNLLRFMICIDFQLVNESTRAKNSQETITSDSYKKFLVL